MGGLIMAFAPVAASQKISDKYKRYLKTIFQIADPIYARQFSEALEDEHTFAAGPYLDVTDSFVKGQSVETLMNRGILSNQFSMLNMPFSRPLYAHQELAIEMACCSRSIVVSTGTGSGKTESFLIPIFQHLFFEQEMGTLSEGVRALIIYPMNALANDQIERLRHILADCPKITFGSYTGQTKKRYHDALAEYQALNNNAIPKSNELISREQLKATPPHILITNYAMLEYLMIRPDDGVFFNETYADKWKFVVLDEAHVYNGSTGIEVSMLLRRLKAKLQNNKIQYILTSATLGNDEDNVEVAEFASNLCNHPFEQDCVIRAKRMKPKPYTDTFILPKIFYSEIAEMLERECPENEIVYAIGNYTAINGDEQLQELLYDTVLHDKTYWQFRFILESPKTLYELAEATSWSFEEIAHFVTVASLCERNGDRLFDARYHMFLRAPESVFITLKPSSKLFLTRKENYQEGEEEYKAFEIAICSSCHVPYLVGKVVNGHLEQQSMADNFSRKEFFLLADSISDTDADHPLEDENITVEEYRICAKCGHLRKAAAVKTKLCEHGDEVYVKVYKVTVSSKTGLLSKCPACENTNSFGMLRQFFTGQEAVTSVIGTALFEELPAYRLIHQSTECVKDDTGFGVSSNQKCSEHKTIAKQFIAFSDNRQAAAFYASYLDLTYHGILYKRLILEAKKDMLLTGTKTVPEFVADLTFQFEHYGIGGKSNAEKEAWKAILLEMTDNNGNTSLCSMGLMCFSVDNDSAMANRVLDLSKEEVAAICSVFALNMMADAAISYEVNLTRADIEYFTYNGIEHSYTLSAPDRKSYRKSFVPPNAILKNKRLDYLIRLLERIGRPAPKERAVEYLSAIWNNIFCNAKIVRQQRGAYKLDASRLRVVNSDKWYICPRCKKITPYNVRSVCPSYQCDGILTSIDSRKLLADNHYYNLYQNMDIRELRIREHTAQLDKEKAYEFQKQFICKEIDVLSCSTTFEMGVDVGTLETVFMRNMPPSPANYTQRAGRAGRNKYSAAYAITFCNRSSHDFTFFRQPKMMIKGKIRPPKFIIENDKIAIRHLYASALGYFWREYPQYFSKAKDMMETRESNDRGFDAFFSYLESKPEDLKAYLLSFLPESLSEKFDVSEFAWAKSLFGPEGALTKAEALYEYEVGLLTEAINNAFNRGYHVDNLIARRRVYQNEDILSYLSRKNVLPKYGFPVDTVDLAVNNLTANSKLGIQLQRDLSIAISEYAPGSQIVANGFLIASRYIRKVPRMSWKMFDYVECENCKTLNIAPYVDADNCKLPSMCRQCGQEFPSSTCATFLIPEFGFEADGGKISKPGLRRPIRTYHTDTAYVGYRSDIHMNTFTIGNAQIELGFSQSDEMAVLNKSRFFVCESCGYTELDNGHYMRTKRSKHKNSSGHPCGQNTLRHYSLGYKFETDVMLMRFLTPDLHNWETALAMLYGLLRGISHYLNIEANDIAGCLQYFFNTTSRRPNYSLVLFDKTPGGAGHVRRLNDVSILEGVLRKTLEMMETCNGCEINASCYTCLRDYYNQKYHDILKRGNVIGFLTDVLKTSCFG
jgi:superfamily II DNA or RNA helicase